jgi:hypothetical protein
MANWQAAFAVPRSWEPAAACCSRLRRSAQPRPQKLPPRGAVLPWEHRQERGFFNAFVETLVMVLIKTGRSIRSA